MSRLVSHVSCWRLIKLEFSYPPGQEAASEFLPTFFPLGKNKKFSEMRLTARWWKGSEERVLSACQPINTSSLIPFQETMWEVEVDDRRLTMKKERTLTACLHFPSHSLFSQAEVEGRYAWTRRQSVVHQSSLLSLWGNGFLTSHIYFLLFKRENKRRWKPFRRREGSGPKRMFVWPSSTLLPLLSCFSFERRKGIGKKSPAVRTISSYSISQPLARRNGRGNRL